MITNKRSYKRAFIGRFTVESTDISGIYASDVLALPIDDLTIANPTLPTGRDFAYVAEVKSSLGLQKTGFLIVYHPTGTYAGKLTIQESSATFATGDVINVVGTLVVFDA